MTLPGQAGSPLATFIFLLRATRFPALVERGTCILVSKHSPDAGAAQLDRSVAAGVSIDVLSACRTSRRVHWTSWILAVLSRKKCGGERQPNHDELHGAVKLKQLYPDPRADRPYLAAK